MSTKAHREWAWKWLHEGHKRQWPYFVTRTLNDIGNYGIRGTVRERVVKGAKFWIRNRVVWKLGLHKILGNIRAKRGIPFKPRELRYSERARCRCGAGLAYWPAGFFLRSRPAESTAWVCADVLTGKTEDNDGHDYLPFAFYEVRSEDQPSRDGQTRQVLFGLLGERSASCREAGRSTRFGP